jgi:hypothetical protein
MDARGDNADETLRQKSSEGPRQWTATITEERRPEETTKRKQGNVNKTLRKNIGLEFVKRATGMSSGLQKMRNWTLWRGQPILKRKKKPTSSISVRRARKMGAPTTQDSFPHHWKKREKQGKALDDGDNLD